MQCLTSNPAEVALEIVSKEKEITITKTLDTVHISELKEGMSAKVLLKAVREILLYSARTFKYAEKMGMDTATTLAGDLIEAFKNDSIEDIVLMLKMARQGQLGKTDGRLDADTLSKILIPNYFLHKAEARDKRYNKEKHAKDNTPISEEAYAKFDELSRRLGVNQQMKKLEQEKINPVLNHHKIYVDKLKSDIKTMSLIQLKARAESFEGNDVFVDALEIVNEEIISRSLKDGVNRK